MIKQPVKVGNSLAIILPASVCDLMGITETTKLDITQVALGELSIKKVKEVKNK